MSEDHMKIEPHVTIRMELDLSTTGVLPPKFAFSFDYGNTGFPWSGYQWSETDRAAAVKKVADELASASLVGSKSGHAQDLGIVVDHSFTNKFDAYEVFVREDFTQRENTIQVYDPMEIIDNPDCLIRDALAVAFPGRLVLINTSRDAVITGLRDLKSFIQYRRSEVRQPEKLSPSEWVKKNLPAHTRVLCRPEADDLVAYAKAAVNTERDEGEALSPTDHIPALRGLFAMARGNYATVSAEDLTAAVDAGYVHPDVLSCVADEIAYATGEAE